ncbi:hypothetical protein L1281_002059 [Neisseria sp. HSC-16F19]|nr:hypothetical protein [Neisseria sp. HSC-16F19]MCP2041459.1 hypothetical protein [Neisseria sp. HSC-16F19]
MDFEFGFKTLWGVAAAAFWFWVNGLSGRLKDADRRCDDLQRELYQVKLDYKTKAEAHSDRENIGRALERIEEKIDKLAERKADK